MVGRLARFGVDSASRYDAVEGVGFWDGVSPASVSHDLPLGNGGLSWLFDDGYFQCGRAGRVGWRCRGRGVCVEGEGVDNKLSVLGSVDQVDCVVGGWEKDGLGGGVVGERQREALIEGRCRRGC